jgi:hypothetical protein
VRGKLGSFLTNFGSQLVHNFPKCDLPNWVLALRQEFLELGTGCFFLVNLIYSRIRFVQKYPGLNLFVHKYPGLNYPGLNKNRPDFENVKKTGF